MSSLDHFKLPCEYVYIVYKELINALYNALILLDTVLSIIH